MIHALLPLFLLANVHLNFDDGRAGKSHARLEVAALPGANPGQWVLRKEGRGLILSQEDATDGRFAMALLKKAAFQDVRVSTRVKTLSGYQGAGVVWRYRDPGHYYVARINPDEGNVRVDAVVDGKRRKLAMIDVDGLETGKWASLDVDHRDDKISVRLDQQPIIDIVDTTFTDTGRVGLWIKDDTRAHFDDFHAGKLPPAPTPKTAATPKGQEKQ